METYYRIMGDMRDLIEEIDGHIHYLSQQPGNNDAIIQRLENIQIDIDKKIKKVNEEKNKKMMQELAQMQKGGKRKTNKKNLKRRRRTSRR